jgi:transcriptional regulator with GAF, ATPase, and Fis domain
MEADVLFTFVGNHDPLRVPGPDDDPGPVLSLLRHRRFDHVVLFITRGEYAERAGIIRDTARSSTSTDPTFSFVDIELHSVVDYEEIYRNLTESLTRIAPTLPFTATRNYVLLDPGTPQMQTVWFLMVQSGGLNATLLQGVPPRFGGGQYRCREVRLDPARFPVEIRLRSSEEPSGSAVADAPITRGDDWTIMSSDIVGQSAPMVQLLERTNRAARNDDAIVCITGETGTGKELFARHIHDRSPRRNKPFIPVNSAGLSQALVESTLFGHKKGAFTGADAERPGAFRSAHGGTLFLDEVGELPPAVQATLLRAIDQGEITPLGQDTPLHVDVRIITATNRDLSAMVADGTFRADLYERLQQLPVYLPPLRDRPGDAELLAQTFLDRWNHDHGTTFTFSPEALAEISRYHWPRNVRQLQNTVLQLCTYADADILDAAAVREILAITESPATAGTAAGTTAGSGAAAGPASQTAPLPHPAFAGPATDAAASPSPTDHPRHPAASHPSPRAAAPHWSQDFPVDLLGILDETERAWYAQALERAGGNRAEAARLLGINPPAFRKALRERFPDLQ